LVRAIALLGRPPHQRVSRLLERELVHSRFVSDVLIADRS
jgi:hypothetical protein